MKHYGTELNKRRYEILMSAGGVDALEWESERSRQGARPRAWLRTKANSIEGGTTEVMLAIVAKPILDLPGAYQRSSSSGAPARPRPQGLPRGSSRRRPYP